MYEREKSVKKSGIFFIVLCCIMMCSCSTEIDFSDLLDDFFQEEVSYKEPSKIDVSDYYTTSYDSPVERELSESEIEIYNLICYYIENGKLEFVFQDRDEDEIIKAYLEVMNDHPEYFWLNKGYRYTKRTFSTYSEVEFTPVSHGTEMVIASKRDKFNEVVDNIVSEAETKESLYDKVLYVHDYIVDNTSYDHEAAEDYDEDDIYFDSRTAYGCLVNGKAVCSGYAYAFQCVMQKLGIPCGYITGTDIKRGESHAWNYLTLGDYNYQIDVTWDDSGYLSDDGETTERKPYDYFLVTTDEMELTHIIDRDQNVPECNGLEYNYYIYNNLYFPEYEFEYVAYTIRENVSNGSVSVKFGAAEECLKAVDDLITNNRIFRIDGVNDHVTYIQGNNGLTLTFTF